MNKQIIITAIFFFVAMIGCSDENLTSPESDSIEGDYDYSGYSGNNELIVSGTFNLIMNDSTSLQGKWDFESFTDEEIGPQVGEGNFGGLMSDDNIALNLNPNWVDNNVLLSGTFDDGVYSGAWQWVTFAGVTKQGTFTAVKK